jgi:SnoaL-like domain
MTESPNALFSRFVLAIGETDTDALREMVTSDVRLDVPGARFADITRHSKGMEAICDWAKTVREECGRATFVLHRSFENGGEVMANGEILIERLPRTFASACACHAQIEAGKIASFQLLMDTFALQKFRGEFD